MRKLLIWDGDNTLWDGIIANGDLPVLPKGRFSTCKLLSERGVLQSLATHNLAPDVNELLHRFDLSTEFLHNQADFGTPKSQMVQNIMEAYDISKETDVVYLDDDPFNRADVKTKFPGIYTDHADFLDVVIETHFTKDAYTEEDRLRVRRYQSEIQRKQAGAAYGNDHQAFLKSCNLTLTLAHATTEHLARIIDLLARANRMAALAQPYTSGEVLENLEHFIVGHVRDKFGDYGLSAVALVYKHFGKRQVNVEALVISCRLQGRGIGSAILGAIINSYAPDVFIEANWRETKYNQGVTGLYEWYDFRIDRRDDFIRASLNRNFGRAPYSGPPALLELPPWVKVEWK